MSKSLIKGIFSALAKIARHRIAVWKAGRKLGVPISRLIKHDNSKFSRIEFMQYVHRFELGQYDEEKWAKAWEHHWRNNDHHIEYWQEKRLTFTWDKPDIPNDNGIGGGVKHDYENYHEVWMPDNAIREMIADWIAASLAYSGQYPEAPNWDWGNKNIVKQLKKLEIQQQPEICTRGFAVTLLKNHKMITNEQVREALVF